MKVLVDTQFVIWYINDAKEIEPYDIYFENTNFDLHYSVINLWEIQIKYQKNKLKLPSPPETCIKPLLNQSKTPIINIEEKYIYKLQNLPPIHRDPFDRMLICQALVEDMTILTADPLIKQYQEVKTI